MSDGGYVCDISSRSSRISPLEHIESDLKEISTLSTKIERIFLVNGDAFTLPYNKLMEITESINTIKIISSTSRNDRFKTS